MTFPDEALIQARIEALRIAKELAAMRYLDCVESTPSVYDGRTAEQQQRVDAFDATMCATNKAWWNATNVERERKREIGALEAKAFMETWKHGEHQA